jgi:hypothetical protein
MSHKCLGNCSCSNEHKCQGTTATGGRCQRPISSIKWNSGNRYCSMHTQGKTTYVKPETFEELVERKMGTGNKNIILQNNKFLDKGGFRKNRDEFRNEYPPPPRSPVSSPVRSHQSSTQFLQSSPTRTIRRPRSPSPTRYEPPRSPQRSTSPSRPLPSDTRLYQALKDKALKVIIDEDDDNFDARYVKDLIRKLEDLHLSDEEQKDAVKIAKRLKKML